LSSRNGVKKQGDECMDGRVFKEAEEYVMRELGVGSCYRVSYVLVLWWQGMCMKEMIFVKGGCK